jgi:hypothetical protein
VLYGVGVQVPLGAPNFQKGIQLKYLILTSLLALGACNAQTMEYFRTVEQQRAEGYKWEQIPCRQVTPGVPAITIDPPTGKKLVCNKLVKQ